MDTSPSSGLFILALVSLPLTTLGRNQGALRRLAETSVSSLQAAGCKLLYFPNWDAGGRPHPLPQRLTLQSPHQEKDPCHEGQSGALGSIMLVSASVSEEDWSPQALGDQLLLAFRCKITVCNLNSS